MAFSPLAAADTPRADSPSLDDAHPHTHTMPTQGDAHAEPVWVTTARPATTSDALADDAAPPAMPPKGKEKATKGPLRLLDLPVDILKEIIHQVRWTLHMAASQNPS